MREQRRGGIRRVAIRRKSPVNSMGAPQSFLRTRHKRHLVAIGAQRDLIVHVIVHPEVKGTRILVYTRLTIPYNLSPYSSLAISERLASESYSSVLALNARSLHYLRAVES